MNISLSKASKRNTLKFSRSSEDLPCLFNEYTPVTTKVKKLEFKPLLQVHKKMEKRK